MEGQTQSASTARADNVFIVYSDPVMKAAVDMLEKLGSLGTVVLRAKGNNIPNAVAIANIITKKMMRGTSRVEKIIVDSDNVEKMGSVLSIIEITISKV